LLDHIRAALPGFDVKRLKASSPSRLVRRACAHTGVALEHPDGIPTELRLVFRGVKPTGSGSTRAPATVWIAPHEPFSAGTEVAGARAVTSSQTLPPLVQGV
jgi:hypothetical protein